MTIGDFCGQKDEALNMTKERYELLTDKESVVAQIKREEREVEKEQDKKIEPKSRSL